VVGSKRNNVLTHATVRDSMRRQVVALKGGLPLSDGVSNMIKYKISAVLVVGDAGTPEGVVSKTDIMGAYYAGLPIDTPLSHIMTAPPIFCHPDTAIEDALGTMRSNGIYRLFINENDPPEVIGSLAYPDIVGMLYSVCRNCAYSHAGQVRKNRPKFAVTRITVSDVMTQSVRWVEKTLPLTQVMEALSSYRFGAMLIAEKDGTPCGVISKTDLVMAFRRGVDAETPAEGIMSSPVRSCHREELIEDAIRQMILSELHRLFVHETPQDRIVGVLSLTDAARRKSGSCRACVCSRIKLDHTDAH